MENTQPTAKESPTVVIAAFADEFSYHAEEHLEFAAKYNLPISARFSSFSDEARREPLEKLARENPQEFKATTARLKVEGKIKNICELTPTELDAYAGLMGKYGVVAWDIGSPLGKQYLGDFSDKEKVHHKIREVAYAAINAAKRLDTQRIRMFTLYPGSRDHHPNADSQEYGEQYRETLQHHLRALNEVFRTENIVGYIENESNLFGYDGRTVADIIKKNEKWSLEEAGTLPSFLAYFDGANMVIQDDDNIGLSMKAYIDLVPYLGGIHVKDALCKNHEAKKWPFRKCTQKDEKGEYTLTQPGETASIRVNEEADWPFVPVGEGDAGYHAVFQDLRLRIPEIEERLAGFSHFCLPREVGLILEPHLLCGGQFGGFSGSRFPEALDSLRRMLNVAGIGYQQLYREKRE